MENKDENNAPPNIGIRSDGTKCIETTVGPARKSTARKESGGFPTESCKISGMNGTGVCQIHLIDGKELLVVGHQQNSAGRPV